MKTRVQIAFGLALLLGLISFATVLAKGEFSFITISGTDLKDVVRVTDRSLTSDYFAFADFYLDKTTQPANPGTAYEITRYYIDGGRESAFDRLYYYPETGFVFYEGLVGGTTEYDGKWYKANPDIKTTFEAALPQSLSSMKSLDSANAGLSVAPAQSNMMPIVTAGLVALLAIVFFFRKPLFRGG
jgi:hypothetical protein